MKTRLARAVAILFAVACGPAVAAKYEINWGLCPQPDPSSAAFKAKVRDNYDRLLSEAAKAKPQAHVALQINRYYPTAVTQRRKLVADSYLQMNNRPPSGCAVSDANYIAILALRDAVYRFLCRSEVGIGTNTASRLANHGKVKIFTEVYEALKSVHANMAASDDPSTPAGGADACYEGVEEGKNDPFPTAAQTTGFDTHMGTCDALPRLLGAIAPELKEKAVKNGICVKEGG